MPVDTDPMLPLDKFDLYIINSFVSKNQSGFLSFYGTIVKTFFDLARNFVLTGVLCFAAGQSGSVPLYIISIIACALLFFYGFIFIMSFRFEPFHGLRNQKIARVLNAIVAVVFFVVLYYGLALGMISGVTALVGTQGR